MIEESKLAAVRLLLLDVDGVLTDGAIVYNDDGIETKAFNVRDGLGIRLLMDAGIEVGIVTGRKAGALAHRCENLGLSLLLDGIRDKGTALDGICRRTGKAPEEIAFMGDDLPDLPLMKRVGVSIAVADACKEVRQTAGVVTKAKGGKGAVREIAERILQAAGKWEAALERFA